MPTAVVIGGGHNGLVVAWLLASSGWEVSLLERQEELGGACSTRYFDCGCYLDEGANAFGMIPAELLASVAQAAGEPEFPGQVIPADPQLCLPLASGGAMALFYRDPQRSAETVADQTTDTACAFLELLDYLDTAIEAARPCWSDPRATLIDLGEALERAIPGSSSAFLSGSLRDMLRQFVTDPRTLGMLATGNLITNETTTTPGTALPSLYLGTSSVAGAGGWGTAPTGMAGFVRLLTKAARIAGAQTHRSVTVTRIIVEAERALGVEVTSADGARGELRADVVVSAVDPVRTWRLAHEAPSARELLRAALADRSFDGACAKINVLAPEPPRTDRYRTMLGLTTRPPLTVLCPDVDYLDSAVLDHQRGQPSDRPYVEVTDMTALDESASCGKHFPVAVYSTFYPYAWAAANESLARRSLLEGVSRVSTPVMPWLTEGCTWADVLTPVDIERRWGMSRGNVDHGPMSPKNMMAGRGVGGAAAGATPVRGLYLGAAGSHPGGLVSGLPALNCFQTLSADASKS